MITLNINEDQRICTIVGIVKESPLDIFLESEGSSMIICNYAGDKIRIHSKEIALNLIKALEKAIELNWVK